MPDSRRLPRRGWPHGGGAERRLGHHARMALESPIGPGPFDQHHEAVAKPDQEVDVREKPEQPGRVAAEAQRAERRHAELDHRRAASDGGEIAVVGVAERAGRHAANTPQQVVCGVAPHLLGGRADAGHRLRCRRAGCGSEVADDADLGVTGNAQVRLDGHPPDTVRGDAGRRRQGRPERRSADACGPDHGATRQKLRHCLPAFHRRELDTGVVDAGHLGAGSYLDAQLL